MEISAGRTSEIQIYFLITKFIHCLCSARKKFSALDLVRICGINVTSLLFSGKISRSSLRFVDNPAILSSAKQTVNNICLSPRKMFNDLNISIQITGNPLQRSKIVLHKSPPRKLSYHLHSHSLKQP